METQRYYVDYVRVPRLENCYWKPRTIRGKVRILKLKLMHIIHPIFGQTKLARFLAKNHHRYFKENMVFCIYKDKVSSRQKLGIILQNKWIQSFSELINSKQWDPKLIFFQWKTERLRWFLELKVRFWHFLTARQCVFSQNTIISLKHFDFCPEI